MKPITKDVVAEQLSNREFPDFVIQAFNECISESKVKGSTTVYQDDVVKRIVKLGKVRRQKIYDNNWLDVESHYQKAGWKVTFYQPAYNESGTAYFTFS